MVKTTATNRPYGWVVGRGGLLGSHLEPVLAPGVDLWAPEIPFHWEEDEVTDEVRVAVDAFAVAAAGRRWQIAWCAGAGIVASSTEPMMRETAALVALLDALADAVERGAVGRGAFFFSSSAGALYAGAAHAPFDEDARVQPLAPYGYAKVEQERLVHEWAARTAVPTLIGRIANLYGPGQRLDKPQGLISQLCRSHLRRQPLVIYVPLDTVRDYLFAPDCARMIAAGLSQLSEPATAPGVRLKVMASQRGVTVGAVLAELRRVGKRPPLVSLRSSDLGRFQVRDLRLRSVRMRSLDKWSGTSLPAGLNATYSDLRARQAAGRL
jgi:UDP-glucose 4-epimerase